MVKGPPARPSGLGKAKTEAADAATKPIDLAHLARQTMGDRALEQEILQLFARQARSLSDDLVAAKDIARLRLAHTLKGSALSVGAFPLAEAARSLEEEPDNRARLTAVSAKVDQVCKFIAAMSR